VDCGPGPSGIGGAATVGSELQMTRHLNKFCGHGRLITSSTMLMEEQQGATETHHNLQQQQGKLMKLGRSESSLTPESRTGSSVKISQSSTSTRVTTRKRLLCEGTLYHNSLIKIIIIVIPELAASLSRATILCTTYDMTNYQPSLILVRYACMS
jgi:hypothetical protein